MDSLLQFLIRNYTNDCSVKVDTICVFEEFIDYYPEWRKNETDRDTQFIAFQAALYQLSSLFVDFYIDENGKVRHLKLTRESHSLVSTGYSSWRRSFSQKLGLTEAEFNVHYMDKYISLVIDDRLNFDLEKSVQITSILLRRDVHIMARSKIKTILNRHKFLDQFRYMKRVYANTGRHDMILSVNKKMLPINRDLIIDYDDNPFAEEEMFGTVVWASIPNLTIEMIHRRDIGVNVLDIMDEYRTFMMKVPDIDSCEKVTVWCDEKIFKASSLLRTGKLKAGFDVMLSDRLNSIYDLRNWGISDEATKRRILYNFIKPLFQEKSYRFLAGLQTEEGFICNLCEIFYEMTTDYAVKNVIKTIIQQLVTELLADEEWRDVVYYENYAYEISSLGRLMNTAGDLIKGHDDMYYSYGITRDYVHKTALAHVLVASSFIGNIDSDKSVDHIDGNTHNNKRENLRIVDQKVQTENRLVVSDGRNKNRLSLAEWMDAGIASQDC